MDLIRQWIASSIAFLIVSYALPGFRVENIAAAVVAAAVLGLLNMLVKPILLFFTLPITLLTLGLFILVLNGIILWLVTLFVPTIHINNPGTAILAALLISLMSWFTGGVLKAVLH